MVVPTSKSATNYFKSYSTFIAEAFDSGGKMEDVYTDFTKAFDHLNYYILLKKLNKSSAKVSIVGSKEITNLPISPRLSQQEKAKTVLF